MNDQERREAISEEEVEQLERLAGGPLGAMAFPLLAEAHRRSGRPEAAERVAREGLRHAAPATAGRIALALALLDQKRGEEARAELEGILGSEAEHAIARDAAATLTGARSEALANAESDRAVHGDAALDARVPIEPDVQGPFGPPPPASPVFASEPDASFDAQPEPRFDPPPPPAPVEALVFGGDVADGELDDAFAEAESEREGMLGADDVAQAALAQVPDDDELADSGAGAVVAPSSPFATETVATLLEQQGHGDQAERVRAGLDPERPLDLAAEPEPLDVRPDPVPLEAPADVQPTPGTDLMPLGPEALADPATLPRTAAPDAPADVAFAADPDVATSVAASAVDTDPLADLPPETGSAGHAPPKQPQATLERWLDNLRRDRR